MLGGPLRVAILAVACWAVGFALVALSAYHKLWDAGSGRLHELWWWLLNTAGVVLLVGGLLLTLLLAHLAAKALHQPRILGWLFDDGGPLSRIWHGGRGD